MDWLGLVIGNSRLHWAWFKNDILQETWDTPHLDRAISDLTSLKKIISNVDLKIANKNRILVYLASVVPSQTALFANYPQINQITLADIPLSNTYSTLGIDRALAIYGAGETYHYPCLVIDGGTALTFTGVDEKKTLIGGAILPGLRSQLQTLNRQTAALPEVSLPSNLPPRWASDTDNAIASGIVYTIMAGIESYVKDWQKNFPDSAIIFTGGDSKLIFHYFKSINSSIKDSIVVDKNLTFWGLRSAKNFKLANI